MAWGSMLQFLSVLFITLISMLSIHPRLLGCSVLSNCDAVAAHVVLVSFCASHALQEKQSSDAHKTKKKNDRSLQCGIMLMQHSFHAAYFQCSTLTTPSSTPNSRHILSIVFPINSASLAPDPIRCS